MRSRKRTLGNSSLTQFDAIVIGSGAGGAPVAEMLCRLGQKVLVIEAGPNYFGNLDDPDFSKVETSFSNDVIKLKRRWQIEQDPLSEPRSYRPDESKARTFVGEVNNLPKTVGGGTVHADMKTPRFHVQDFRMRSLMGDLPGASFADWPIQYDELEKFYLYMERVLGVQGVAAATPYDAPRSAPYPMVPGVPMYVGELATAAAAKLGYHGFAYPCAITSQVYDGRPACNDCGYCSGFGCPIGAKGSSAVTALRKALLTGNCLLLSETRVTRLIANGGEITGLEALGPDGEKLEFRADRYVLAASPIEDARLLFLSDLGGPGLGNSSGFVGRNLMFHFQTYAIGIFKQRLHSHRGKAVSHGIIDFRGTAGDPNHPMGGVMEVGGEGDPIDEGSNYASTIGLTGGLLKRFMKESPLRDRLLSLLMQGEDAPQLTNRIDLDPDVRDADGLPVARITYKNHAYELSARKFYSPKMLDILGSAGASYGFIAPADSIAESRHVMGTLRFGTDPKSSVCDANGKFHDLGNLYASDGALFPTSSGLNPTLTLMAVASRVGAAMVFPDSPERGLP